MNQNVWHAADIEVPLFCLFCLFVCLFVYLRGFVFVFTETKYPEFLRDFTQNLSSKAGQCHSLGDDSCLSHSLQFILI